MFSRNKNKKTQRTVVHLVPSIISSDLLIKGDLESVGEIQVDGQVFGDIHAKVLLVGKSATVNGEIYAETVRVHGNVNGQIKAKFVNLEKSAHVVGDIHHENLAIKEGAFLEGRMVHMNEQEVQKTVPAAAPAAQAQAAPPATSRQAVPLAAPVADQSANGKPAEDRVNLVVKSGKQGKNNKHGNGKGSQAHTSPQNNTQSPQNPGKTV